MFFCASCSKINQFELKFHWLYLNACWFSRSEIDWSISYILLAVKRLDMKVCWVAVSFIIYMWCCCLKSVELLSSTSCSNSLLILSQWVGVPCGAGAPLFPLVHLLPHLFPFLLFSFFHWLYLFSSLWTDILWVSGHFATCHIVITHCILIALVGTTFNGVIVESELYRTSAFYRHNSDSWSIQRPQQHSCQYCECDVLRSQTVSQFIASERRCKMDGLYEWIKFSLLHVCAKQS